jgi:hypothetical protein
MRYSERRVLSYYSLDFLADAGDAECQDRADAGHERMSTCRRALLSLDGCSKALHRTVDNLSHSDEARRDKTKREQWEREMDFV